MTENKEFKDHKVINDEKMKQNWEIKKLGECFEFIKNGANIKQERGAGGIPITRIETLSGGAFNRDRLGFANIETIDKYQSYVMESGDLLLSHINSKFYIGRIVVYVKEGDETIIHGMNLLRLKALSQIITPYYIYYYSQTHKFKSQIANRRKDAVNQSSISVSDLKTIPIPVPPLPIQEKIVAELDCLSGVIEKKKEQLKELDALAQSIFYTMFGDPITNEKGWEVKKLGEVATLLNGRAYKQHELLDSGKYKVLRVGNFFSNSNYYYSNLELEKDKYCDNGDLLFAWSASFGAFIWNGGKVIYHYHIWKVLYDNKMLNIDYYRFLLNTMTTFFMKDVHGIGMVHLTKVGMEQYNLPIPPLPLQQEFADKIEAIEKQKELIKESITETEELFNARMQYYFG